MATVLIAIRIGVASAAGLVVFALGILLLRVREAQALLAFVRRR
jgi:hypothetical protein